MTAENPIAALRYLLQDDIYLLKADQNHYRNLPADVPQPVAEETPALTFQYMGGNKKQFLVISHYTNEEYMAEAHLKALESTLGRISFTIDDIALVNKAKYADASMAQLTEFFAPSKLLILGTNALPADMRTTELNAAQTINGVLTLYTFSFDEMMGHKENTKAFWNQIKTF